MAQARTESMVTENRDPDDTDTEPLIYNIYPESDLDQRSDVPGLSTDASSNTAEPNYSINKWKEKSTDQMDFLSDIILKWNK